MNIIDSCIGRLMEVENDHPFWREFTEAELDNDIMELNDDLKFSEEEGTNVIKIHADVFLHHMLEEFNLYISKGYDLMFVTVDDSKKKDAIEDIAKFIASTYVKGNLSVKIESSSLDIDWISKWSLRKATLMVKKMESDIHYRIFMELIDEEKPSA